MTNFKKSRMFFQFSFLIYILTVSTGKALNLPWGESLHAICPLGATESFSTYLRTGTFIKHTGESNWIMMLSLFLISLAGGAIFCGWICPFGTIQEYLGRVAEKLGIRKKNLISKKWDRIFRNFKYIVLIVVLIQSARYFKLVFETYDPYYTIFNLWSSDITLTAVAVLGVTLILSLFIERAYCKYFCPLGAINGIMNRINIFRLKKDRKSCIDCKLCDSACPMDIKVSESEDIKDSSCTKCMKCSDSCPVNKKNENMTLGLRGVRKNWLFLSLVMGLFFLPIAIGSWAGKFQEADEIKSYQTTEDIRGSFTLDELINNYGVDKELFIKGFGLPKNYNSNLKVKELSDKGITLDNIRNFIRYKDTVIKEIENIKIVEGTDIEKTLNENIKALQPGSLKMLFLSEEIASKTFQIKRKTMLVEIEKMVKNYDEFLKYFGIDKSEMPNTTINDLEPKYNIKFENVKTYIQENSK